MRAYNYPNSPSGRYELRRAGVLVMTGTEVECWQFVHQTHSYSFNHALQHEGYTMHPIMPEVK